MMMRKPLLCLLALFACVGSGCTETKKEWIKDGIPKDVVKRQLALCQYKAELDAGSAVGLAGEAKASRKDQVGRYTDLCMKANGFKEEEITIYK